MVDKVEGDTVNNVFCEICGDEGALETMQDQTFEYVDAQRGATLISVRLPVTKCGNCESQYTDERSEKIKHDAVCRHLGRLTHIEIKNIRRRLKMAREAFSELTGLGVASIARWESGKSIQTLANDRYLRLLTIDSNVEVVKSTSGVIEHDNEVLFSHIAVTEELKARATQFNLVATG